jgi:cytochrome c oxidase subunit 2
MSPRILSPSRLVLAGLIAGVGAVLLASPAFADGTSVFFPTPVSPNAARIDQLYKGISVVALFVFVAVELWILYVVIRFRRRGPDHYGKQVHGNVPLEVAWFIAPTIIVTIIAYLSFAELQRDFKPEAATQNADMTIVVHGIQFAWNYTYPDNLGGFTVTKRMVVPVGKMVHLEMESDNVIHSWWVPALMGKTDAVPGYTNHTWIKIDPAALSDCRGYGHRQPDGGCVWLGQCAELCGAGHNQMTFEVEGVTDSVFQGWVAKQKAAAQAAKNPSPSPSATASKASPARTGGAAASPSPSPSP